MAVFKITGAPVGGVQAIKIENASSVRQIFSELNTAKGIDLDLDEIAVTINGQAVELDDSIPTAGAYIVEVSEKDPDSGVA